MVVRGDSAERQPLRVICLDASWEVRTVERLLQVQSCNFAVKVFSEEERGIVFLICYS